MRSRRLLTAAAVIAAVGLTLAACDADPTPSATPTVDPSPSSTPADAAPTAPELIADGACDALLTDAEVSSATGFDLVASPDARSDADIVVETLGGITCGWEDATGPQVWLTVHPRSSVDAFVDAEEPLRCYGACAFSRPVGDAWFAGVVYTSDGTDASATAAIETLAGVIAPRLEEPATPAPWSPSGAWGATSCEQLAGLDVSPLLDGDATVGEGSVAGEAGPGVYLSMVATGWATCTAAAPNGTQAGFRMIPAAGWAVAAAADAGGATVPVAGHPDAVVERDPAGWGRLLATDGANLVIVDLVSGTDEGAAATVAGRILDRSSDR